LPAQSSGPNDDGFREIQLNFKQLVFLFMAATVVLVVTFLAGLMAGRGVRVQREEAAQAAAMDEAPATPAQLTSTPPPEDADPRRAAPPAPADEGLDTQAQALKAPEAVEEPPVAVKRSAPVETPAAAAPKPVQAEPAPKPAAPKPEPARKPTERAAAAPPAAPAAEASAATAGSPPARTAAVSPVADTPVPTGPARSGYAVQVAAVNARGEADAIARRLSGKGYSAYVEVPKGSPSIFRVRVGTFKTRREAQSVADRLKKEEKFKPWVTR
jgi:cell division septation protein DedD